ncbi:FliA/WhiG family RNA polymerase sigma factor [Sporolactobacillus shoreicorticis]|uniref:FliA/WhiG family RNA polymerase sigma factor n=1 Tax=Sporolactobacillus shoreicorticis TaxID=1923877 RepID=A0ABW5S9F8_9BACL|nr:FliA/WhiG family RNA polymerase sigma factor [Sporolactobacillus shoreicorticis]MCO7125972.1 FliA/WhiG family RNA polymerase sigma factor [Sporolactobacillus shoreicorticis]
MESKYWDRWVQSHDAEAANCLLELYMPLVNYHVQRIGSGLPRNIDRGELQSFGLLGLYDALEKFDRQRDLKFDTYASFRIRGAILDGLRKEDWMPRSTREKSKKIEKAAEQIEQEKMRSAKLEEVADVCGLSPEEVSQVLSESLLSNLLSLDDGSSGKGGEFPSSSIEDNHAVLPEKRLVDQENRAQLAKEIDKLSEKERLVVSLFYFEELTLTEIGQILNLSTSRISQIHSKALFKLRQYLSANEMRIT